MDRNHYPFEKIFADFDSKQQGGLSFHDFKEINKFVGVALANKNLKKVYDIIDKEQSGVIVIEQIRAISKLKMKPDEGDVDAMGISDDVMEQAPENLKGKDILIR